jgi:hypothetical protein
MTMPANAETNPTMNVFSGRRAWRFFVLVLVGQLFGFVNWAAGADDRVRGIGVPDFSTSGIKFRVTASITSDPASPYAKKSYQNGTASLAVKVRISSHARESRFYGEVIQRFSDFYPNAGSDEKMVWEESTCHQRRGLPKVTVTFIDGSIRDDKTQIAVAAQVRQRGMRLPLDEITPGMKIASGTDSVGPFSVYRAATKLSHLLVNVKVYAFDCQLLDALRVSPSKN